MFCHNCGNKLPDIAKFCSKCGTKVAGASVAEAPPPDDDEDEDLSDPGTFTDPRDNKTYRTVKIGKQIWLAENLKYNVPNSKIYEDKLANLKIYGRLYTWEMAKKACPPGWHLPNNDEWDELTKAVGGKDEAGMCLKAESGWNKDLNGTDEFGFSALPGGYGYEDGSFGGIGDYGQWWSASKTSGGFACHRCLSYDNLYEDAFSNELDFSSVRCIKD